MQAFTKFQRVHAQAVAESAKSLAINPVDFWALVLISDGEASRPSGLGELMQLTSGAATSLADRLARAGLIIREPDPVDRRSVRLVLTDNGQLAVARFSANYITAFEAAITADSALSVVGMLSEVTRQISRLFTPQRLASKTLD